MSGRQSQQVASAVKLVTQLGYSVTFAAKDQGVAVTSVRRALRSAGVPPLQRGRKPAPKP